jgi:hypothetical protein
LKRFRAGGMASAGGASSRAGPGTVGCRRCVIPSARKTWQQCPKMNLQATATLLKLDNDIAWCVDRSTCRRHARREWRERFKFGSFSF